MKPSVKRSNKQMRDDGADEGVIVAVRVKQTQQSVWVEVLIISSYSRHLGLFPKPQGLLETSSSKDLKPARHETMSYVSLAATREHLGACYLSIGINYNFSVPKIVGMRESAVAVLCLTILDLCVGLWFYPALAICVFQCFRKMNC